MVNVVQELVKEEVVGGVRFQGGTGSAPRRQCSAVASMAEVGVLVVVCVSVQVQEDLLRRTLGWVAPRPNAVL